MRKFETLTSVAAPLPQDNIDTDIIYPARFLLITRADGLEDYCFSDWRFDRDGKPLESFPLSQPAWKDASILVTGANFGCGSSREHAPWSLRDLGIRAMIAPSFGEIFFGNCLKNGLLPIRVSPGDHALLMADAQAARPMTIDLQRCEVRREGGAVITCEIPPRALAALLNGWDEVDGILARYSDNIAQFEQAQRRAQPWLWPMQEGQAA